MVDILSLLIGFGIGVVIVAIAIEFGTKKTTTESPSSRRTVEWDISEVDNPKIMAEYLGDVNIPAQSKVLVNRFKDMDRFDGLNVKQSNYITGNYILGDDRALILSGPVKKDELGFWTVEKEIVESLHRDFDKNWQMAQRLKNE